MDLINSLKIEETEGEGEGEENQESFKELFVGNIPPTASASDVKTVLEKYGDIVIFRCEIKPDKFFGFIELKKSEDADKLLRRANFSPPECLGRKLRISKSHNKKKIRNQKKKIKSENDPKFKILSMELGNWAGQDQKINSSKKNDKRNKKSKKETKNWTFISDWKYPKYFEPPKLIISKPTNSFYIEGFSKKSENDSPPEINLRRVKIPFRSLSENKKGVLLNYKEKKDQEVLYISIKYPPELYQMTSQPVFELFQTRFIAEIIGEVEWLRTIDWTGIANAFGKCLVIRIVIKENHHRELLQCLKRSNIPGLPRHIPEGKIYCNEAPDLSFTYLDESFRVLPFRLCFKLECLLSHSILSPHEIQKYSLGERLTELYFEQKETIAWYALNQIAVKHWDPSDEYYSQRPISIFEIAVNTFRGEFTEWHPSNPNLSKNNNERCAWVNHATITPTKIYFEGPTYEPSNRILRKYSKHIDRFIRVTFKDENFDRLFVNNKADEIYKLRIELIMKSGFYVAGRQFEFLAFSSSQLRESSCCSIQAPALYAARMGQCFTSTIGTIELEHDQVIEIEDIKRNGYTFSDGCGTISPDLAKRVTKLYWGNQQKKDKEVPSVFQIRFGGSKGVVSVDSTLRGEMLCLRKSQIKFPAPVSRNLEICKVVKNPLPAHLNRQIIMILSALGIPDDVFLSLQDRMRDDIDKMMKNPEKAKEIVKRSTGSRECSHITRCILSMIDEGLMRSGEPFLKGLLECRRIFALKSLRYRARILAPNGFLLYGILDEVGVLEPDQIFVQTSTINTDIQTFTKMNKKTKRNHKIYTGRAVITRNPCLHPGDIRFVTAVDVPALRHLHNCVIFSQKGDRPLPNYLSGGDLGVLIPSVNEEPMNYDPPERKKLDRPVEISDIYEFFTDFMKNNRLGQIANLHMALADFNVDGVRDQQCMKLAEQHSMAVDFNKSGVPVTDRLPKVEQYPDFMENKRKDSYKSEKILGQLYRRIEIDRQPEENLLLNYDGEIIPNQEFLFDGYEDFTEEAVIVRNTFNFEIRSLMKKFSVKSEPEVITANLLGYRRVDGRQNREIREAISGSISHTIHHYRKNFLAELRNTNDESDRSLEIEGETFSYHVHIPINDETKAKASAWYAVTYDNEKYPDHIDDTRLLSFAWVVADILLAIRMEKQLEIVKELVKQLTIE
ncbi:1547_t:CDS:10 [Diversispora eburnea]|uniref:RNA-dependent RNA polymerase n=1 Tax=Diversispora eburnea TaxID=1213867 RepID=A0A9N9FMK0_9GLOM|nr:1547_t:CDS:10 [Diversispora eburnea]